MYFFPYLFIFQSAYAADKIYFGYVSQWIYTLRFVALTILRSNITEESLIIEATIISAGKVELFFFQMMYRSRGKQFLSAI